MGLKNTLSFDFETFCELDITEVGAYKYASHESCEVLMAAYAFEDGDIYHWDAFHDPVIPKGLQEYLEDPSVTISAFNAPFERLIFNYVLGIELPIERFNCSMAHAYNLGFAGGLSMVGKAIGIDNQKLESGKALIKLFCSPRKPTKNKPWCRTLPEHEPDKWEEFCYYNTVDVEAEIEISEFLAKYPMSEEEIHIYRLDQKINDRGLPIDRELCEKALIMAEKEQTKVFRQIMRFTGIDNPNSRDQLMAWFKKVGCKIPDLQAATVDEWVSKPPKGCPEKAHKVLTLKQLVSKSSISKYQKILTCAMDDDRVRGTIQYSGAPRTRRWAGRLIQPQNFARPPKGFSDAEKSIALIYALKHPPKAYYHLVAALRGAICAPDGEMITDSDLAGIEGRVLPWLANDMEKVKRIANGRNMYFEASSVIYGIPYEEMTKKRPEYMPGKIAELALGFQGSIGALNNMAKNYGLEPYKPKEGYDIVDKWRKNNSKLVDFWAECQRAFRLALGDKGKPKTAGRLTYIYIDDFMFCHLPSGGQIAYYDPFVSDEGTLCYYGLNSYTKKWTIIETYGGKLAENATQATAREILAYNMRQADKYGFKIVGSIHDEILTCQKPYKKYSDKVLSKVMSRRPPWAEDLPLGAAGYMSKRYKKDD